MRDSHRPPAQAQSAPTGALPRSKWMTLLALAAVGCASSLPPRYVIERDLGTFAYRRYQKSFDIEVPIAGNQATGHTASYLQRSHSGEVEVATAFVTVYAHARSLAAEARAALQKLGGYTLTPSELAGEWVWLLDAQGRERWCVWVSGARLVKLGVQAGRPFPDPIVRAYLELYPSDLDERGLARPDAASAGSTKQATEPD